MEINIKGTPVEIKELLQAIASDKGQQDYQKINLENFGLGPVPPRYFDLMAEREKHLTEATPIFEGLSFLKKAVSIEEYLVNYEDYVKRCKN